MLNFKLAGLAGEGIAVTGTIFSKLCMRQGLKVFAYGEYPSLIRGGHNTVQVSFDPEQATAQKREVDVLVALNADGIKFHTSELTPDSIILVDKTHTKLEWEKLAIPGAVVDLPMYSISMEVMGSGLAANVVALGAACYLFGLDLDVLKTLIAETFEKKGAEVIAKDQDAAELGYKFAEGEKLVRKNLG
jgi:2-oxoglutarate ferredoxin oxidoreductase subunit alpha